MNRRRELCLQQKGPLHLLLTVIHILVFTNLSIAQPSKASVEQKESDKVTKQATHKERKETFKANHQSKSIAEQQKIPKVKDIHEATISQVRSEGASDPQPSTTIKDTSEVDGEINDAKSRLSDKSKSKAKSKDIEATREARTEDISSDIGPASEKTKISRSKLKGQSETRAENTPKENQETSSLNKKTKASKGKRSSIQSKEQEEQSSEKSEKDSLAEGKTVQIDEEQEESDGITKLLIIFLLISVILNINAYKLWDKAKLIRLFTGQEQGKSKVYLDSSEYTGKTSEFTEIDYEESLPNIYPKYYEIANQLLQICLARRNVSQISKRLVFNQGANIIFELENRAFKRLLPVSDDELWVEQQKSNKTKGKKVIKTGDELTTWTKETFNLSPREMSQIHTAIMADRIKGDLSQLLSLGTLIEKVKHPKYGTLLILRGIELKDFDVVKLSSKTSSPKSLFKGVWYETNEHNIKHSYQVRLADQVYQCQVVKEQIL